MAEPLLLSHDKPLAIRACDLYGAQLESAWVAARGEKRDYSSDFLAKGYFVFPIPADAAGALRGFFEDRFQQPFDQRDVHPDHFGSALSEAIVLKLNAENIYYGAPSHATRQALADF